MPRIAALYRYPLKGFSPEPRDTLAILPEGRAAGDRVLNLRFADAPAADTGWCRKYHGVVLANTPGLARLATRLDAGRQRLRVALGDRILVDEGLDDAGRKRIVDALTQYVLALDENPLKGHPERLPLKLVGDGVTPRYQDNETGQVTLHGRETLAAVSTALDASALSELRFRSNIAIEGIRPWEEQDWLGRRIRIGPVVFDVAKPKVRCLATHANPVTGERDLQVMQGLKAKFRQQEPTFGVGLLTHGPGGEVRVGDEVVMVA